MAPAALEAVTNWPPGAPAAAALALLAADALAAPPPADHRRRAAAAHHRAWLLRVAAAALDYCAPMSSLSNASVPFETLDDLPPLAAALAARGDAVGCDPAAAFAEHADDHFSRAAVEKPRLAALETLAAIPAPPLPPLTAAARELDAFLAAECCPPKARPPRRRARRARRWAQRRFCRTAARRRRAGASRWPSRGDAIVSVPALARGFGKFQPTRRGERVSETGLSRRRQGGSRTSSPCAARCARRARSTPPRRSTPHTRTSPAPGPSSWRSSRRGACRARRRADGPPRSSGHRRFRRRIRTRVRDSLRARRGRPGAPGVADAANPRANRLDGKRSAPRGARGRRRGRVVARAGPTSGAARRALLNRLRDGAEAKTRSTLSGEEEEEERRGRRFTRRRRASRALDASVGGGAPGGGVVDAAAFAAGGGSGEFGPG